jgi:hypothetical protein
LMDLFFVLLEYMESLHEVVLIVWIYVYFFIINHLQLILAHNVLCDANAVSFSHNLLQYAFEVQISIHHFYWLITMTYTHKSPCLPIVSNSKVEKGDTTFTTHKRILGWDIDSSSLTLHPPHRVERLTELLNTFLAKKHTPCPQWQKLLGELRSMTLALHSSVHLLSTLQHLLQSWGRRLHISPSWDAKPYTTGNIWYSS